jgi:hypothetical protein
MANYDPDDHYVKDPALNQGGSTDATDGASGGDGGGNGT